VPTFELARDARVLAGEVKFDRGAAAQTTEWEDAWRHADPDESTVRPAAPPISPSPTSAASTAPQMLKSSQTATWTFPIEITVRVGAAAAAQPASAVAAAEVEKMVEPFHDDDYSMRKGYDPNFIGVPVPLPTVTNPSNGGPDG
jgi:endonuclease G, mitochondrial